MKLFILRRIPSPSFRLTRGMSTAPPVCGEEKYAGCVIRGMLFVCFFFVLAVLEVKRAPITFSTIKGLWSCGACEGQRDAESHVGLERIERLSKTSWRHSYNVKWRGSNKKSVDFIEWRFLIFKLIFLFIAIRVSGISGIYWTHFYTRYAGDIVDESDDRIV